MTSCLAGVLLLNKETKACDSTTLAHSYFTYLLARDLHTYISSDKSSIGHNLITYLFSKVLPGSFIQVSS